MSAWWGTDGIEPPARRDCVYGAATAPAILTCVPRIGSRPASRTLQPQLMRLRGPRACLHDRNNAAGTSAVGAIWRRAEVLIPKPCGSIPLRTGAGPCPVDSPELAEPGAHDAHTSRCHPLSKRCRTPSGSASDGGRVVVLIPM